MTRKRTNVFTKHKEGARILQGILDGSLTQREAAKQLNCTEANISIYLRTHNLKRGSSSKPTPQKRNKFAGVEQKNNGESIGTKLEKLENLSQGKDSQDIAKKGWIAIQAGLLLLTRDDLTPEQYVRVAAALRPYWEFEFKNQQLIEKREQIEVKINPEQEKRILSNMEEFCNDCPYRNDFNKRKDYSQETERLVS